MLRVLLTVLRAQGLEVSEVLKNLWVLLLKEWNQLLLSRYSLLRASLRHTCRMLHVLLTEPRTWGLEVAEVLTWKNLWVSLLEERN